MKSIGFNQEYLHEALHYSPSDGLLTWKERPLTHFKFKRDYLGWNKRFAGTPAFRKVDKDGYLQGHINNRRYQAHRIIWFMFHGEMPKMLDHRDNVRSHNWIENLRICTNAQNQMNSKCRSKTGFKGVRRTADKFTDAKRYQAGIMVSGKAIFLGLYPSAEEAHAAYLNAAEKHFGEFSRAS